MRSAMCGLAIAVTIGVTPVGAGAESTSAKAPEGHILVDEEVWLVVEDEAEEHFHRAHESFVKKDLKKTAADIRKGAAFLKLEAGRATEEGKKLLEDSSHELTKLAEDVEYGATTSVKRLDEAFAHHHHLKAKESWTNHAEQAPHKVGQDLQAAAKAS